MSQKRPPEVHLRKLSDTVWEIPKSGDMRVPGRIYASDDLIEAIRGDRSPLQVANVAHLPGIVEASLAMPDIHWGYGFPIGGVAATDPENGGVVSPGGVGYDINCGVRILRTNLMVDDLQGRVSELVDELFRTVPTGLGASHAIETLRRNDLLRVLRRGAAYMVEDRGMGSSRDLEHTEENGCLEGADPGAVSARAIERGRRQLGTLGSGNHFLEVGVVDEVYADEITRRLDVRENTVCVLIHTGSRGFGYQVCHDHLGVMQRAVQKYAMRLPDRQLCCAPVQSPEGRSYLGAMACAANYAWANRQTITHLAREAFMRVFEKGPNDLGMELIYDVCHNIAKLEEHSVDGETRRLCVHRKGATRAFPAGDRRIPPSLRAIGQPVLVPGDMGRCSFVLIGAPAALRQTFGSTCHGAGRMMEPSEVEAHQSRPRSFRGDGRAGGCRPRCRSSHRCRGDAARVQGRDRGGRCDGACRNLN